MSQLFRRNLLLAAVAILPVKAFGNGFESENLRFDLLNVNEKKISEKQTDNKEAPETSVSEWISLNYAGEKSPNVEKIEVATTKWESELIDPDLLKSAEIAVAQLIENQKPVEKKQTSKNSTNLAVSEPKSGKASSRAQEPKTVNIQLVNDIVGISPLTVSFAKIGEEQRIQFSDGIDLESASLIVRDTNIVHWNAKSMTLTSLLEGETELFFLYKGKLKILPIKIKSDISNLVAFDIPKNWTDLDSLVQLDKKETKASIANVDLKKKPIALEDPEKLALMTLKNYSKQSRLYAKEDKEIGYTSAVLQIIDERSVPEKGILYPVVGVEVSLVGTEFSGKTNATGQIEIPNLPVGSRFLVIVSGIEKGYVSGISEFHSNLEGETFDTQITVLRSFTHDMMADVAGVVQIEDNASFCGTVYDSDGFVLSDISLDLDQEADGPYFFNRFGYLDQTKKSTGLNGRFCFFNILPGPVALDVSDSESFSALIPMNAFAGLHQEEDLRLSNDGVIKTRLAALATVYEQLNSDKKIADQYRQIDMIDLVPLGSSNPLMQLEEGLVTNSDNLMYHHSRLFGFSQAAEFEPTIYSYDRSDSNGIGQHVTPLIPRGFVEDMSLYANVVYNPELGTIVIEHGKIIGQGTGAAEIKLVDQLGRDVGEGWYFSDEPITKAIFFNLNPGKYSVMVETQEGYWLAADTVLVYNETVSYIRLGARTRYR